MKKIRKNYTLLFKIEKINEFNLQNKIKKLVKKNSQIILIYRIAPSANGLKK